MNTEYSPFAKRFVHNGITYHRQDDLVFFKMKNKGGDYLGVEWKKTSKNLFKYKKIFKTNSENAFIFVLSKEIFDEMLCITVVQDLKKQFNVNEIFGDEITPILV